MASNYQGYLVKIGSTRDNIDWIFPLDLIMAESFNNTLNGQDLDSGRDSNGTMHRDALNNAVPKCEFETPPLMSDDKFEDEIMSKIRARYVNAVEKDVWVSAWCQETNSYIVQRCYVPDITFNIYSADEVEVKYNRIRIAFIGYGKE